MQAMVKELCRAVRAGQALSRYPYEMLDENKWLAARHGLDGELVDLPEQRPGAHEASSPAGCSTPARARRGARLGRGPRGIDDLLESGNGAARQIVVYEANHDLREVMGEIVAATVAEAAAASRAPFVSSVSVSEPDLFVVCKNCCAEVSPYVTECPYCGSGCASARPRSGPGGAPQASQRRGGAQAAEAAPGRDPRDRAGDRALRDRAAHRRLRWWSSLRARRRGRSLRRRRASWLAVDGDGGAPRRPVRATTTSATRSSRSWRSAIFGTLLERRFGTAARDARFVRLGAAGAALTPRRRDSRAVWARTARPSALCAWLVDDRRAARRGDDRENDLLGVLVIAGVLLLCPRARRGDRGRRRSGARGRRRAPGPARCLLFTC